MLRAIMSALARRAPLSAPAPPHSSIAASNLADCFFDPENGGRPATPSSAYQPECISQNLVSKTRNGFQHPWISEIIR